MKKITLWLFALFGCWQINAQVNLVQNFNGGTVLPAGWTETGGKTIAATESCEGNSIRDNLYSFSATGTLVSPNQVGASNGTDLTFSFDYKIENWSSTVPTPAGWGNFTVDYSTDNGTTWITFFTVNDANHVVANTCATFTNVIPAASLPTGSDFRFRFNMTWASGDYDIYFDNISATQVSTIAPDCTTLITPADGAVNVTSSVISWSVPTGIPDGYYLTVGTTSGGNDILDNFDVGNVTSYNIGALVGSTTYYVTIIPYNSIGDAIGCTETSFSSCFINVAPWTYDVETAAATTNSTIADCWSSSPSGTTAAFRWDVDASGGTPSGTSTGPSGANSGVKYFYTEATSGTTGAVAELYTPLVDLSGLAEPTLQFYYHMHGVNMGALHVDVFDGTTWTNDVLVISGPQQTAASDPWTLSIVSLNAFSGSTIQVRFRGIRGASFESDMSLDDISFEEAPSCFDPINLGATNITADSFDLLFTDASGGNQFDFNYVVQPQGTGAPATFPAGDYEDGSNTLDGTNYIIPVSGLAPNTSYEIYVAADCNGNWVGPFNFITPCEPYTVPYFEGFENGYTHDTPVASCLSQESITGTAVWRANNTLTTYNRTPRTGAWNAFLQWSNEDWLFIPIELVGGTSYTVETYARQDGATASNSNVGISYGTTNTAAAMTNVIVPATGIVNGNYQLIVGSFIPATDGVYYIGIKGFMNGSPYYISLDDIAIYESPTSPPDCAVNVLATPNATCGNFATTISWDAVADTFGYNLTIGTTSGGNDVLDNQNIGNVTSYSFVGNIGTTYYYTISPYNANGPATSCVEQSFTTFATGCYCSPSSTSSSTYVDNFTTTGGSQNISNLSTGFTTGGYLDSSAQFVESFATSSFDFNAAIVGGTAGFSIWVDWNNDLNFDNATEKVFNTTAYGNGPFTGTITIPAGTPIGNYRMRITTDWNSSNPSNPCTAASRAEFEDYTITVIAPPSCVAPSGLNVTSVSASSANLGWTENGTAASWDVEWGALGFTPTGTPTISGASNPEIISGLSPNTAYSFYVRANCGVDGFSGWSGPFNFTTSCIAEDVPYSQNFESATIPNLPTCTSQQNVGSGNLWTVVNNPGYGFTTNALRYSWNTSNAANVWFFTNGVNLVGGTTYKISYDYGSASSFYVESLRVSYGSSATAVGMTDLLAEHPTVNNNVTPINNEIEFTPATSGVYYFGFNAYSIANQFNLYVDNILVDVALSSNTFDNNNFTAYPNPVKDILNLTYTSEITSVRVINMLGQEVIARSLNATNAQVDMSQLSAGTYIVNVTIGDTVKTIKVVKQ